MRSTQAMTHEPRHARSLAGFTLIELMVAMLLGLIVIAGVASVFLANLKSYQSNTALNEIQTNSRIAYALMARDIRQAGLTGCDSVAPRLANVLNNGPYNGGTTVWANWSNAVHGYGPSDTDPAVGSTVPRVANTDSLMLMYANTPGYTIGNDDEASATFTLNETSADLATGDIILVCDQNQAALMQISNYGGGQAVQHASGGATPGNCSTGLGYITSCATANTYTFSNNARLYKVAANDWYVGSKNGISSLYRVSLENNAGVPTLTTQEMIRNVTNMQLRYHISGAADFASAASVANWADVDAVRVTLTLRSTADRVGTDQQPLSRSFTTTTTIRNRVQ